MSSKVSPTPKPRAKKQGIDRRDDAKVLYRALQGAGDKGLSWQECFALCDEPGSVVTWLRSKGVDIAAPYDPVIGETRFALTVGRTEGP